MIFEKFYNWPEERLGLMGGLSFVLMGVFAYLIYMIQLPLTTILMGVLIIILSALTALFFQLPRIKGLRAAISTFIGGIMLGLTIIVWALSLINTGISDPLLLAETALLFLGLLLSSFFGFGFLFIAIIPPQSNRPITAPKKKKRETKRVAEEEEEDFIDRL